MLTLASPPIPIPPALSERPPGWLPPAGIMPGAAVAVETPGGLLSGLVVGAEITERFDPLFFDTVANDPFGEGAGPGDLGDGRRGPGFVRSRYGTGSRKLDLRVRLDTDSFVRAGPDALDEVRGEAVRRAVERVEQLQTDRLVWEMARAGGGGVTNYYSTVAGNAADETAGGLWSPRGLGTTAGWATYTTGAATSDWGQLTVGELTATMARIRATLGATANTSTTANPWSVNATRPYTFEPEEWSWESTAAGYTEMRMTVRYSDGWALASGDVSKPKTPADRLREMIRDRMAPAVGGRARDPNVNPVRPGLRPTDDFRELRARETLAKIIGEDKFRRFVRDGFVTCRAKSGKTYQIFPGGGFTRVYQDGQELPRLCVVLRGKFPPTDSVIVRYLLLLNDEARFLSLAVNQGIAPRHAPAEVDGRSLSEIYQDLKQSGGTRRSWSIAAAG